MMNSIRTLIFCLLLAVILSPAISNAQDAIYRIKPDGKTTKMNGKITDVTPAGATVGGKLVPVGEIDRLYYNREPAGLNRARQQMEDGRYSDSLEELEKLDASAITDQLRPEYDFIRAYSTSRIALTVGSVTPQAAGKEVRDFMVAHPTSIHLSRAIEQYGKLLFAFGRADLAIAEYQKLANCPWPEYQLKGLYQLGKTLIEIGKLDEAQTPLETILSNESNDETAQTYKLLARAELARVAGLGGNVDESLATLNQLIDVQSAENGLLFANLYNAVGSVHNKAGNLKEARMAYLHTNLLYASETDAHAEALYHLAKIWPKLEETDRANESRETLKTRYRNSYWAAKVDL